MTYVILDPVKMTYDGGYAYKDHALRMLEFCRTTYKQPSMFLAFIDGDADSALAPHFTWMADTYLKEVAEVAEGVLEE